jgi:5-hmdU DNA kinase-like protein
MKVEQVKELSKIEQLLYWCRERESIRLKKEAGEKLPYTDDLIFQSYRFCNVIRADDKVSRWLQENWYIPNFGHKNMLPAIAMARHFNKIETLQAIGFPKKWDLEKIKKTARDLKASGVAIYSAAYIVRGNSGTDDKVSSVMDYTVQPLVDTPIIIHSDSMKFTWGELRTRFGFGDFMAGQCVADLRWAMEGTWEDAKDWAPPGPGSQKGMNRLLGRSIGGHIKEPQFVDELQDLKKIYAKKLPSELFNRMEMIDIQNTLCEFSKYTKTLHFEGRPKQLFNGFGDE